MAPTWRKSTRSGGSQGGQGDCVELANLGNTVGIRDSKNPGPHLAVNRTQLGQLVSRIKHDEI